MGSKHLDEIRGLIYEIQHIHQLTSDLLDERDKIDKNVVPKMQKMKMPGSGSNPGSGKEDPMVELDQFKDKIKELGELIRIVTEKSCNFVYKFEAYGLFRKTIEQIVAMLNSKRDDNDDQ